MAIFGNFKGTTQPDFRVGKTGARIHGNSSQPATADSGDFWLDKNNSTIQVYESNAWTSIGSTLTGLNVDNGTLFVDAANDTVSIGSTSSNEKLFVNGSLRLGTNPAIKYSGAYLDLQHSNGTGSVIRVRDNTGNTDPVFKVYNANNTSEIFKVQGNVTTTGNLIPRANLTYSLGNATNVWSSIFTDSLTLKDQLTIGSQVFYAQGNNGFSVNEDFDPSNSGTQTAYHFTSGAGRETVAFTLARTGQFTNGFGIYGTSSANKFVMFGEQSNTGWEWRTGVGIRPLDLDGGTLRMSLSNTGALRINNAFTLPTSDGTNGQVLTTNGSGTVTWGNPSAGGIGNVVEDTTPQLGGNLDAQSYNLNNVNDISANNILLLNDISANIFLGATCNVATTLTDDITVVNSANLGAVGNITITGGSNGQAIITDGSGNLSFAALGGDTVTDYGFIYEANVSSVNYGTVTNDSRRPISHPSYTVSEAANISSSSPGDMIFVSDETGGATMAFYDGTDWRRIQDRQVIS